MLTVSDNWDFAIRSSAQRRVTYVDIYYPQGSEHPALVNVPVRDFSVRVDTRSDIRRTASIVIDDADLIAALKTAPGITPLEPYGSEFVLKHGVRYANGTEETVSLGYYHAESVAYSQGSAMTIPLVDRSKTLKRKLYGFPRDAGGQLSTSVIAHPLYIMPYVELIVDEDVPSEHRIPGGVLHRGDMLSIVQQTADTMGCEFFFNTEGKARVRVPPALDTTRYSGPAAWEVNCGSEGVLINSDVSLSRENTYNRVLVIGVAPSENTPAVYADLQDDNAYSPTYYYGPFGQTDLWIDDPTQTTYEDCSRRAIKEMRTCIGLSRRVSVTCVSNPALEEGDIVRVTNLDGTQEYHLIEGMDFNQTGQMKLETRTEQIP